MRRQRSPGVDNGNMIKRAFLLSGLALYFLSACAGGPFFTSEVTEIFLVRHAEKEPGRDPDLTPAGRERANKLAERLADAKLDVIYSTDYTRTRQTAAPIALESGLPVIYYDPAKLDLFAAQIREQGGRILVVGHSNTTPQLVTALGGQPGTPIVEATEYDRLYVIRIEREDVTTDLQRYGAPSGLPD